MDLRGNIWEKEINKCTATELFICSSWIQTVTSSHVFTGQHPWQCFRKT